jgi:hypothetical protein
MAGWTPCAVRLPMRFPSMLSSSAILAALCSTLLLSGGCGGGTEPDGSGASPTSNGGELGGAPSSGNAGGEDLPQRGQLPGDEVETVGRITICHVPPGNPANAHTLNVSVNGWNGHQRHKGDYAGPCGGAPDAGTTTPDAGTTTPDAGTTTPDAGTTTPDAGTTTPDAGEQPPVCIPEGSACGGDGETCCGELQCAEDGVCRGPVIID